MQKLHPPTVLYLSEASVSTATSSKIYPATPTTPYFSAQCRMGLGLGKHQLHLTRSRSPIRMLPCFLTGNIPWKNSLILPKVFSASAQLANFIHCTYGYRNAIPDRHLKFVYTRVNLASVGALPSMVNKRPDPYRGPRTRVEVPVLIVDMEVQLPGFFSQRSGQRSRS